MILIIIKQRQINICFLLNHNRRLFLYLLNLHFRRPVLFQHEGFALIFLLLFNHLLRSSFMHFLHNLLILMTRGFLLVFVVDWSSAVVVRVRVLVPYSLVDFALVLNVKFSLLWFLFQKFGFYTWVIRVFEDLVLALSHSQRHWFFNFLIWGLKISNFCWIRSSALDFRSSVKVIMIISVPGLFKLFLQLIKTFGKQRTDSSLFFGLFNDFDCLCLTMLNRAIQVANLGVNVSDRNPDLFIFMIQNF